MTSQSPVEDWKKLCLEAIRSLGSAATGRAIHDFASSSNTVNKPQFAAQTYVALARLRAAGTIKYLGDDETAPRTYALVA
jgi:hypothetical protein